MKALLLVFTTFAVYAACWLPVSVLAKDGVHVKPADLKQRWFPASETASQPFDWFVGVLKTAASEAQRISDSFTRTQLRESPFPTDGDKFFRFVPEFVTSLTTSSHWSSPCFQNNTASVQWSGNPQEKPVIRIDSYNASSELCSDLYLIATVEGLHILRVFFHGEHRVEWDFHESTTESDLWWVRNRGFYIFRFLDDEVEVLEDLIATVDLFYPTLCCNRTTPQKDVDRCLQFLEDYANDTMPPRTVQKVTLNKSEIHSGDFLGIIRMDGLDVMEAFGMGAHTGHTATCLWIDEELYVVESTDKTNYWPYPNIQKNKWDDWLKLAEKAQYNLVHLPLSPYYRNLFNETSASDWFLNVAEGLPYGYHNYLFGWIDTPYDNLPLSLSPQLLEIAFSLVDKIEPKIGYRMWTQAFSFRVAGTNDAFNTTSESYMAAQEQRGLNFTDLIIIPEQDEWEYDDGYSMVCDVLVCELYKAAGLFGNLTDEIQCTEFQNWDVYSLKFFDSNYTRPKQCIVADPDSQFCQLLGANRMSLPGYNTRVPFPHMSEKCPGLPPQYDKPPNC